MLLSILNMASWFTYFQIIGYAGLLLFMVPIRIKKPPDEIEMSFPDYLKKYNKTYNATEYVKRLRAFEQSLLAINTLNQNRTNSSALYGLTKYSDLLPDEFMRTHLQPEMSRRILKRRLTNDGKDVSNSNEGSSKGRYKRAVLPQKVDWREKNVLTPIKNQKDCGACWAFSSIEMIESLNAIKSGKLVPLSVQEAIDCARYNNDGCNGGDICSFLNWVVSFEVGLQTEGEYPLTLKEQQCKANHSAKALKIIDYSCDDLSSDEELFLQVLAEFGPVAVAINAQTWQNYIGGVIQYHCENDPLFLNHAVQIVGYDLTGDIPHYIVRNTWGTDFGDKGYLYIAIGKNLCGIVNEVAAVKIL